MDLILPKDFLEEGWTTLSSVDQVTRLIGVLTEMAMKGVTELSFLGETTQVL